VVGSGISGLGAAWLLSPYHDVVLFEASDRLGGHALTVNVGQNNQQIPVDIGFIVYNQVNYPNLTRLFEQLNVPVQKSNMSFAVSANNGELEYCSKNISALFAQPSNFVKPAFWRMFRDITVFNRTALADTASELSMTVGELINQRKLGNWFEKYYLLPMSGAIWSTPRSEMLKFPAHLLVRFFEHHGLLSLSGQYQWWTVTGGSQNYVSKLVADLQAQVRLNTPVEAVFRRANDVSIKAKGQEAETYDSVIFACHSDTAFELLQDGNDEEKKVLSSIPYRRNRIVLHQDKRLMPKRKACWSSWVYLANSQGDEEEASVTYWMNSLQGIPNDTPFFATLNPCLPIDDSHIFAEHQFDHPQYDCRAVGAQALLKSIQGQNNTWFCGAWTGMGFHEDGLLSAINVANKMGVSPPWS